MSTNFDPSRSPQPTNAPVPPATSGKAIASLVCGVLSIAVCGFGGIPAVILGMMSLGEIKQSQGRSVGRGLAIAGIVTGVVGLVLFVVSIVIAIVILMNFEKYSGALNDAARPPRVEFRHN